jgi:hypothetical protein
MIAPPLRSVSSAELRVQASQRIGDLLAEPSPRDRVPGLIPASGVVVVYGDSQSGKTFWAMDLCAHIALGLPLQGKHVQQGSVLYVIAEGQGGFPKRLRALVQKFPDLPAAPFRVIRQAVNLREMKNDLLVRARDAEEDGGDLGLVALDTLSQTLYGDENGADVIEYIGAANWLAQQIQCPILIVHHEGKDSSRGMRGHSALRGNVDAVIHIKANAGGGRLLTTDPAQGGKTRDDEPVNLGFRLMAVPVGRDVSGREITSCIVEYQDQDTTLAGRKPVTGAAQKLLIQLAGDLARASARYRPDGTPVFSRDDLESAWAAAKKATGRTKYAAPSYLAKPLADLLSNGHLMGDGTGVDLWFPR